MKHRSAIVGGVLGVVLLVVVAGFAIFLPKVHAEPEADASIPALPDKLGDLVALDSPDLPAALAQQVGGRSQVVKAQTQATKGLDKVFDAASSTYRFYASEDARAFAAVTVLNGDPGLFAPDGPPVDETSAQQPTTYQLARVRGAVCAEYYAQQQATTQGQASGPLQLSRAHCQLGSGGRTYDIDSRNLSIAKTVAALRQAAAA